MDKIAIDIDGGDFGVVIRKGGAVLIDMPADELAGYLSLVSRHLDSCAEERRPAAPADVRRMAAAIRYALDAFAPVVRTGRLSQGGEQRGNLEQCEAAMHGLAAALRGEPHPMIPE